MSTHYVAVPLHQTNDHHPLSPAFSTSSFPSTPASTPAIFVTKDEEYPTYDIDTVDPTPPRASEVPSTISKLADSFLPSLLGILYLVFCIYVSYINTDVIVSHSTDRAAEIRGALTAAANIWVFITLLFVGNLVDRIRAEEWYRRLSSASYGSKAKGGDGAEFQHLNHVSSNLGGTLRQAIDLFAYFSGSSRAFKAVFVSALISLGLNELAPSLLQLVPG
ncbi:hypothetical protein BT69DRAFT_1013534 [Atractiella rhizophila]|nr:hypothetical protein BT69DRAFT_1013534 [Atractiella rhizophila]